MKPCRSSTAIGPALPARMTMPSTSISVVARRADVVLPSSVTSTSALELLGSRATDPARAMVFEAAAYDANIVRELRRGDRVAVEGRQSRPLYRVPDGRSRDPEKPLCRHPVTDRGTAAAARHVDDVKRSVSPIRQNRQDKCVLVEEDLAFPTFDAATEGSTRSTGEPVAVRRTVPACPEPVTGAD